MFISTSEHLGISRQSFSLKTTGYTGYNHSMHPLFPSYQDLRTDLCKSFNKSRINKISNPHHNMSMYDKFTAGPNLVINGNSPERNISHIAQYN